MKKRDYPKTVFRKKLIQSAFWGVFSLALFFSVIAVVRAANVGGAEVASNEPSSVQTAEENKATSVGAQAFAGNFAQEYFNWENTEEGQADRVERLSDFIATGLDEQAGLGYEGMEWDSNFSSWQAWDIEETGKNSALITLRITHELTKYIEPGQEEIDQAKKEKKDPPEPVEEREGPYEKYFVVPVKTDGESYAVYNIPYIVAAPDKPDIQADQGINEEGQVNDSALHDEIEAFLNTFFKVYASGEQNELSYYVESADIQTMKNVLTFEHVQQTVVRTSTDKANYEVEAMVVFKEEQTKAQQVYPYEMVLTKEDGRWIVKNLKNH